MVSWQGTASQRGKVALCFERHYLSNATCLLQPRSLAFLRFAIVRYTVRHLRQVESDKWLPLYDAVQRFDETMPWWYRSTGNGYAQMHQTDADHNVIPGDEADTWGPAFSIV
jgi:hypothetical protein